MPRGIDPHVYLDMPFMGRYSSDNYETGALAALYGVQQWSSILFYRNWAIHYKLHWKHGAAEVITIV